MDASKLSQRSAQYCEQVRGVFCEEMFAYRDICGGPRSECVGGLAAESADETVEASGGSAVVAGVAIGAD